MLRSLVKAALLSSGLAIAAGQPINPQNLAWDQSEPERVAAWELEQCWDGQCTTQQVTTQTAQIVQPMGGELSARVRALPVESGVQPSAWTGPLVYDPPPQVLSLAAYQIRTLSPLPMPAAGQSFGTWFGTWGQ